MYTHSLATRRRGDAGPADLPDEEGGFYIGFWALSRSPGGRQPSLAGLDFKGGGSGQKFGSCLPTRLRVLVGCVPLHHPPVFLLMVFPMRTMIAL